MRKIIIYGIIIFGFSIGIGFYYASLWKINHPNVSFENKSNTENVVQTLSEEEKISYNASLGIKKYYTECGHFKFNYSELPIECVNLTKSELEKLYPDWRIEKFSSSEIIVSQEIDEKCDEHFILKLGEDNIEVYRDLKNGEEKLYKATNISKEYLTSVDIEKLEEGIYVYGMSNLNSAIEDFE